MSNAHNPNSLHQYFYLCNKFPSALFDTLEQAEDSAELQLTAKVEFYRLTTHSAVSQSIRYIYTDYRR